MKKIFNGLSALALAGIFAVAGCGKTAKFEEGTYNVYSYRAAIQGELDEEITICSQETENVVCQATAEVTSDTIVFHSQGGDNEMRYRVEGNDILGYFVATSSTEYKKVGSFVDNKFTLDGDVEGSFTTFVKA